MLKKFVCLLLVCVFSLSLFGCAASEEVASETVVVEDGNPYSANSVMVHINELIETYPHNDAEHIKALVIAVNYEYISEEDLNILLTTYGYTEEDLAVLFDECALDNSMALTASAAYQLGLTDTLEPEDTYLERIKLQSVCLNPDDQEMASWYDKCLANRSKVGHHFENDYKLEELLDKIKNCRSDFSYAEKMCITYSAGVLWGDDLVKEDMKRLIYPFATEE